MSKKPQKPDLPTKAPKRSGKRGIGPAPDPAEESPAPAASAPASHKPELLADANKKRGPKQSRLPSMEDPEIEALEEAAEDYADIRDQRQELTVEEVRLKTELLDLMHSHKKTEYNHNGVNIKVIIESEKVRVRIKKEKD